MVELVWPNGTTREPSRSDGYGPRRSIQTKNGLTRPFHVGTDHYGIGRICSIGDGTVVESGWSDWAGYTVVVYLGEIDRVRTWVRYCHLRGRSPLARGQRVARGDFIGMEGDTGQSAGVHLHWEIYRGSMSRGSWADPGSTVDPRAFVRARMLRKTAVAAKHAAKRKRRKPMAACIATAVKTASGGDTYAVRIFDMATGERHEYLSGDKSYIRNVALTYGCAPEVPVSYVTKSHFDKNETELRETRERLAERKS